VSLGYIIFTAEITDCQKSGKEVRNDVGRVMEESSHGLVLNFTSLHTKEM
jgi:hypothetical protein